VPGGHPARASSQLHGAIRRVARSLARMRCAFDEPGANLASLSNCRSHSGFAATPGPRRPVYPRSRARSREREYRHAVQCRRPGAFCGRSWETAPIHRALDNRPHHDTRMYINSSPSTTTITVRTQHQRPPPPRRISSRVRRVAEFTAASARSTDSSRSSSMRSCTTISS